METAEKDLTPNILSNSDLKKAILKSQHCQRNWDLGKKIPSSDLEILEFALKNCPSKQNVAFYNVKMIQNRDVIEKIHETTKGFVLNYESGESVTNSQTLANLLIVFEASDYVTKNREAEVQPNEQFFDLKESKDSQAAQVLLRDQNMAVGVAAGYINLLASILGYSTGCCACFDVPQIKEILQSQSEPLLLMGIGFKDKDRRRREHHLSPELMFPTKRKQEIEVTHIE